MLIKRLSEARGISGQEAEVRSLIADEVRPFVDEMRVDNMGNLIASKEERTFLNANESDHIKSCCPVIWTRSG